MNDLDFLPRGERSGQQAAPVATEPHELTARAAALLERGYRLALAHASHRGPEDARGEAMHAVYLFLAARPDSRVELTVPLDPAAPAVPSLAALSFPAARFEREMRDQFGVEPVGHPLARPLVRHPAWPDTWHPMRADAGARPPLDPDPAPFPFLTVEGPGVYEIPVGPVHAGLIEPGHFRFSVVGETILKLKARLWYVHKGVERLFENRTPARGLPLAERVSGDTAVGHALAYCRALEEAAQVRPDLRAEAARAFLLELERLYNHVTDLGALCTDVGHGILGAHAGRIREQLLRINAETTGHRLLRGGIVPGGARLLTRPDPARLRALARDVQELAELALGHSVVRDRFTGTAPLTTEQARALGTLGYVARASGLDTDARHDHPAHPQLPAAPRVLETGGDVLARFQVRAREFQGSVDYLDDLGELLPASGLDDTPAEIRAPGRERSGVGIAEGWRGTIVHRIELAPDGTLERVKVADPSFFNWPALPVALTGAIVPDFPLVNKSFNLSYAGNDL
ncbi:NADH-quinone oxidoreductase subunit C [Actinocrinis puniceicyclus]|uniref:NADH-quinone oxidoreductase subunit C n=1 Tax=Actinocrinis puniceicyclus TaxID=977794 RepID=A0A8J7WMX4_9ACTN|nr:NADH-quinone oxidoreductase subunit C [Actinocrinis puniceicyclus]MBS2964278.1 NADH-quinone oxidoreductase subunit C [Actinocrinis puniceicyclus]